MRAENIEIDLTAEGAIEDGKLFKGEATHEGSNIAKVKAWLKKSKFPSAEWFFYVSEDVPKGENGDEFTPKPISIKDGQFGLFCDGPMFQIDGLSFPLKGTVDFDGERKSITLKLASDKQIKYLEEKKGYKYVYTTDDDVPF